MILKEFFFPFQPQQQLLLAFRILTPKQQQEHPTLIQMHQPQLPRPQQPPGEAHTWSHLRINNTSPLWPLQGNSYQVNWFPIVASSPNTYVTKTLSNPSSLYWGTEATIPTSILYVTYKIGFAIRNNEAFSCCHSSFKVVKIDFKVTRWMLHLKL